MRPTSPTNHPPPRPQDCTHYFQTTGRRVTFEYTLMAGVNDQPHHVRWYRGLIATVSLRCFLFWVGGLGWWSPN